MFEKVSRSLKYDLNCHKYVTVPGIRDQFGNFFKIELLLPQGRVGFELQNALHINDESKV